MNSSERILDYANDDELIHLLQKMVQHRSYSGEEKKLADFLADYLKNKGLEVIMQEVEPNRFNVIGILKGTGEGQSLMYNGHIDTNPVGRDWTVDPFAGKIDSEFIYGIGVSNMKASDAAFISAVLTVIDSGTRLKGDVIIGLVVGELQGGIGTLHLLESGITSDWFINGEPTDNSLLTLHAGAFEVQIDIFGLSRHLSKTEEGINAIEKAQLVIEELKKMTFSGATNEKYKALNRYNIGVIRGGLGDEYNEWRVPQLPDKCTLKVALRYAPSQSKKSMISDLQRMIDHISQRDATFSAKISKVDNENRPYMEPFEVDEDELIVRVMKKAHQKVTNVEPLVGDISPYKFYGTDAAHLMKSGIKGIVYGCGGKYNTMPDERVELSDLKNTARVYTLAIQDICNREK